MWINKTTKYCFLFVCRLVALHHSISMRVYMWAYFAYILIHLKVIRRMKKLACQMVPRPATEYHTIQITTKKKNWKNEASNRSNFQKILKLSFSQHSAYHFFASIRWARCFISSPLKLLYFFYIAKWYIDRHILC